MGTDFHMPDSWYDPPDDDGCECDCDPCVEGACEECPNSHPFYDDYEYDPDLDDEYEDLDYEEDWNDD